MFKNNSTLQAPFKKSLKGLMRKTKTSPLKIQGLSKNFEDVDGIAIKTMRLFARIKNNKSFRPLVKKEGKSWKCFREKQYHPKIILS